MNLLSRRHFLTQLSLGAAGLALSRSLRGENARAAPRKLGVALVGLGNYSSRELGPALKTTQHCQLRGIVTGTPAKAPQWIREYGLPEKNVYSYDTMHQMADNRDIDIVYVVTPNGLHAQHAIAAAKAGKHVIVEKPMANNAAECDAILHACRENKVKCSVGYRLHFDPYHRELKRLGREQDFGRLTKMTGKRAFPINRRTWRIDQKLAGGGALMDIGIYLVQAACMAAGEVAPIAVTAEHLPKTKPELFDQVEEGTRWTMEFPGGEVAEFVTSYQDSGNEFRAEGDGGWIEFPERGFSYRGIVGRTSRGPLDFNPPVNQQALQMDDFALCVREGRESIVSGEMGRRDNLILDAIYESARTGRPEKMKVGKMKAGNG